MLPEDAVARVLMRHWLTSGQPLSQASYVSNDSPLSRHPSHLIRHSAFFLYLLTILS